MILDFQAGDADAEYPRIAAFGVDWIMLPATQPWGSRSMVFRDPAGTLVNVFSRQLSRTGGCASRGGTVLCMGHPAISWAELVASGPDGLAVLDADGRLVQVSSGSGAYLTAANDVEKMT